MKIIEFHNGDSASVESRDGWAILWRAALHQKQAGVDTYYDDEGRETSRSILLFSRLQLDGEAGS